ncbi:MAG: hypothetical protein IJ672_07135 [Methanobrevibacter sp.]|nr:hypothetical protein [Methanobrevibacter sp.]
MKKIELKKYVTCIICIVMFGCILTSCENDQDLSLSNQINDSKLFEQKNAIQSRRSVFNNCGIQIKPGEVQPFPGEPVHGLPNQTIYKFFVGNPSSDVIKVEVMFSAPDGNTYYDYMQKNSSGNWFLEKKNDSIGALYSEI